MISRAEAMNQSLKWLTKEHFRTFKKGKYQNVIFSKISRKVYNDHQEVGKLFLSMKEIQGNFSWQLTTKSLEVSHKLICKFNFKIAIPIALLKSSVKISAAKTAASDFKTATKIETCTNI